MARLQLAAMLLLASLVGACSPVAEGSPTPAVCDGISATAGGCDPDRPTFAGRTCSDVAREFGTQLDERLMAIYNGPATKEESKAVRASSAAALTIGLANVHLRRVGLIKQCSAGPFLDEAEAYFSPDLKAHAGEILDDGPPSTYARWRTWVLAVLVIIDQEEDAPAPSS